ncbi:small ribosomal subunit protein mS35 [Hydra vulgaris]|uniref:28S ribosomal protein S35,mitochondrial n=1 Tax=Hydra vulgaris TaxID=6087 RepID=T2MEV9_HYDVU|nr:28S ribosomal protein S35, mitochondrial [Hydra vulgaris]
MDQLFATTLNTTRKIFSCLAGKNCCLNVQIRHMMQGRSPVRVMGLGKAVSKKSKNTGETIRSKVKTLSRADMLNLETTDWSSVYCAAESYNPSVIPLPIRMGRPYHNRLGDVPPNAKGNVELLKIPNFFHLTPPAIKKHCEALSAYCTPWPIGIERTRPIKITTINHVYAGPSIRHPNSRMVKLEVQLKDLDLDDHARRKLKLLVGDRYNPKTDKLSLVTDKCPTRKQNKDYAYYLLTALYHESWKTEEWENEFFGNSEEEVVKEIEKVNAELFPKAFSDKKRCLRHYKIINDKLVRYNNVGRPFLVELGKHGLKGLMKLDEVKLAMEKWNQIQVNQNDIESFDPLFQRSSESEFKQL